MNHNQSSKQNQRIQRISDSTLVIGVDIAKFNHVARAFNYRGMEVGKRCLFYNDESGLLHLLEWIITIQKEHGFDDVILGVEPTGTGSPCFISSRKKVFRWCLLIHITSRRVKSLMTIRQPRMTSRMQKLSLHLSETGVIQLLNFPKGSMQTFECS